MTPEQDSRHRLWRFHTKTLVEHGIPVLFVEGRLGHHSAEEFEKTLLAHSPDGSSTVVIDLSGVDYVSSAALKVFRSIAGQRAQSGGRIRLREPSVAARFALELSGLLHLVEGEIHD